MRTAALAMIEVSYWNGLQMLQYSSGPYRCAVVELIRIRHIVVPLVAVILPGNVIGNQLVTDARTADGGIVKTVLLASVSG